MGVVLVFARKSASSRHKSIFSVASVVAEPMSIIYERLKVDLRFDTKYDPDPPKRLIPAMFVTGPCLPGGTNDEETRESVQQNNGRLTSSIFRTEASIFM